MSGETFKTDLFMGLTGIHPKDFIISPHLKRTDVVHSLTTYTTLLNDPLSAEGSPVQQIASHYLRPHSSVIEGQNKLKLIPNHIPGKGNIDPFKPFYFDGGYNLLLLNQDVPGDGAVVGFDILDKYNMQRYRNYPMLRELKEGDLMIIQLQGPNGRQDRQVLQPYMWEKLLVQTVCDWAESVGFSAVFLLPSQYHNYQFRSPDTAIRCSKRYDLTADQTGFHKQNGLWKKELFAGRMYKDLFHT